MADTDSTPTTPLSPLAALGQAITAAAPQGAVLDARVTRRAETAPGELVVRLRREAVLPVMLMLRDDPRFSFEQLAPPRRHQHIAHNLVHAVPPGAVFHVPGHSPAQRLDCLRALGPAEPARHEGRGLSDYLG